MSEVVSYTADFLGIDESELKENSNLQLDLGLSSFDLLDLSCELEDHFNIKIDTEKLTAIRTIGDLKNVTAQAMAL